MSLLLVLLFICIVGMGVCAAIRFSQFINGYHRDKE